MTHPNFKSTKIEIYRLIDSFLTEAKNQDGKERSLEQLNQDRHLVADKLLELFTNFKK